jgi:tRNA(Ile)-lysidine synthase
MLLDKVKGTISKYDMLGTGDTVLVAVSGGPDSVCLLSVLQTFAKDLDLSLHVAHLDHRFRGGESEEEALFVAQKARTMGIAATIEQFDVPAFCRERGLSAQAGAREVRYGFLNRVAEKVGASRIALGHTASDQAETLVMRLIRGAGIRGLSAIPPVRENIIRPLIEVTREEVLEYLHAQGIEFATDPSNAKPVYTRNRVRLAIMPVLRAFNPNIVETLASEAAILRDENEAFEAYLDKVSPDVLSCEKNGVRLKRDEFNTLPTALKRRMLRKAVSKVHSGRAELSFDQVEDAIRFLSSAQTGRAMDIHAGLTLEREYHAFIIRPKSEPDELCVQLAVPGFTGIPKLSLEVEILIRDRAQEPENPPVSPFFKGGAYLPPLLSKGGEGGFEEHPFLENYLWQAEFDYDKIAQPIEIRTRRAGDRFCPFGMGGKSKKLQDYFVDKKVPRRERDIVPILASKADVIWVIGMRTDERFLPKAETKRVLAVGVRKSG